jgi:hypothetical protein
MQGCRSDWRSLQGQPSRSCPNSRSLQRSCWSQLRAPFCSCRYQDPSAFSDYRNSHWCRALNCYPTTVSIVSPPGFGLRTPRSRLEWLLPISSVCSSCPLSSGSKLAGDWCGRSSSRNVSLPSAQDYCRCRARPAIRMGAACGSFQTAGPARRMRVSCEENLFGHPLSLDPRLDRVFTLSTSRCIADVTTIQRGHIRDRF